MATRRLLIQHGALPPALQTRLQASYDVQMLPQPGAERDAFLASLTEAEREMRLQTRG